ncbi:hemolymph lipopolysaccharide-binding protein-like isoform X2 [Galleria mellonella]|nr:hemolymph lipopolysaccharide-binding protein-like isoform X2 [Galleria mellonella]
MASITDYDIAQVHEMLKEYPDIGDYVWVQEEGPMENRQDIESEEALFTPSYHEDSGVNQMYNCDVLTRQGKIETGGCIRNMPFVCKVDAKDAYYDAECKVYGKDYQYEGDIGSCYKIPMVRVTWDQAYAECKAEGAHLVVINSEAEQLIVWNMTKAVMNANLMGDTWYFYAGYRANRPTDNSPRVFLTIFNQTLDEAGFNVWSRNEPNNYMNREYCGSIFKKDGRLNDIDCTGQRSFICEKEIK